MNAEVAIFTFLNLEAGLRILNALTLSTIQGTLQLFNNPDRLKVTCFSNIIFQINNFYLRHAGAQKNRTLKSYLFRGTR